MQVLFHFHLKSAGVLKGEEALGVTFSPYTQRHQATLVLTFPQ